MRNRKDSHGLIRQNEYSVKKSQKHDANLQKNSTFYFQVGLIVCLLVTYGLFEMNFETRKIEVASLPPIEEPYSIDIPLVKTEKPEIQDAVKQKTVSKTKDFIEVPDDIEVIKDIIDTPDDPFEDKNPPINPGDIIVDDIEEEVILPIDFVHQVPVYPGCENKKNNDDRKKCMSQKLSKLIQRSFNGSEIASEYGIYGKQRITVQFLIDKTGKVKDIKTRAPHPKLGDEAQRVINRVPVMQPGKQNKKTVGVRYTLPIVFDVQN
ncbi:energy transducer TonB [Seonamhaeicola maritimus]|uniref:energy transducer TonB n=1 Tax=Seonamhaeicola maritimus TaxID=2591822 RepID=UPI002493FA32|nr:energy transducer TonB [Seonamhaeicola maritimus]